MGDSIMPSIIRATTTSGLQVAPDNSGSLQLQTNGTTTAVTIDTSQNVGIGTTTPAAKLQVSNGNLRLSDGFQLEFGGNTNAIAGANASNYLQFYTNNSERMRIDSAGRLLVGTTNASITAGVGVKIGLSTATEGDVSVVGAATNNANDTYHLYSTGASAFRFYVEYGGQIRATVTSIAAISDASLKENIRDLETGLSEVMALRPRRFDWIEETKLGTKDIAGFIAQEVEPIMPDLVSESKYSLEETKKSVRMGDMIPTLVKAIQEQQTIINDLKARIETLEGATS